MGNAPEFGQGEQALSRAATMVNGAQSDLNAMRGKLTDQIGALDGKWGGQGATAFRTLQTAWDEKQRVIVNALQKFEDSLRQTEKDNVSTDEAQSSNMNNVRGRLEQVPNI